MAQNHDAVTLWQVLPLMRYQDARATCRPAATQHIGSLNLLCILPSGRPLLCSAESWIKGSQTEMAQAPNSLIWAPTISVGAKVLINRKQ
jgi:hypothetical protein